jgi:hypothetical protein
MSEDMRRRAKSILDAFALGDRIELEGLPFYCECMMQVCSGEHKKRGACACDRWDAKQGGKALDALFKRTTEG